MAPLELPHISISLKEGEDAAHTAIFDLCNEALEWGIKFEDVEVSSRQLRLRMHNSGMQVQWCCCTAACAAHMHA